MNIGLLLFPKLTQLDLTGPFEVFVRAPGAKVHLVWKSLEPVAADTGLTITPNATFATCPPCDVICVPGGIGTMALMDDEETLGFLRRQAAGAQWITSVCSGSLVLGAAGLLQGYRSACHWSSLEFLPLFGAIPVGDRVVIDRNRASGGGVTAGIDFALTLVGRIHGEDAARWIQLDMEYNPAPPFNAGSPETAPAEVLTMMRERMAPTQQRRLENYRRAAERLS
mgnify:CR=1 FL=1